MLPLPAGRWLLLLFSSYREKLSWGFSSSFGPLACVPGVPIVDAQHCLGAGPDRGLWVPCLCAMCFVWESYLGRIARSVERSTRLGTSLWALGHCQRALARSRCLF